MSKKNGSILSDIKNEFGEYGYILMGLLVMGLVAWHPPSKELGLMLLGAIITNIKRAG